MNDNTTQSEIDSIDNAHAEEYNAHPKIEELTNGDDEIKSYYFISHPTTYGGVFMTWELNAIKAMATITFECNSFGIKDFKILKQTIHKGDMYPRIKHMSVQELQTEAFMESNHAIAKITAP